MISLLSVMGVIYFMSNVKNYHIGFYGLKQEKLREKLCSIKSSKSSVIVGGKSYYNVAADFLMGYCHIFAFALHKRFGYDVYSFSNNSFVHWCCISEKNNNNFYIDVRGITDDYLEFLDFFKSDLGVAPFKQKIDDFDAYEDEWDEFLIEFAYELIDNYFDYYDL